MSNAAILAIAMLLDAIFGEPRWLWNKLPHPAVLMGRLIGWIEKRYNHGSNRKLKGVTTVLVLSAGSWVAGALIAGLGPIVEILVAAILLAQRSLVDHVGDVARALRLSVSDGRLMVGRIVGRDTSAMTEANVARAAIESAAENLSDGVIAPAFWFLIAGLPGLLFYKFINTADSMIGYRTPRYARFGWAAARLDDLLNLIPARLTALGLALVSGGLRSWPDIIKDARKHRSPNAGWPEAAMARALGVALSGPRAYDGKMQDFAWVNGGAERNLTANHIDAAIQRLWQCWAAALGMCIVVSLF